MTAQPACPLERGTPRVPMAAQPARPLQEGAPQTMAAQPAHLLDEPVPAALPKLMQPQTLLTDEENAELERVIAEWKEKYWGLELGGHLLDEPIPATLPEWQANCSNIQ